MPKTIVWMSCTQNTSQLGFPRPWGALQLDMVEGDEMPPKWLLTIRTGAVHNLFLLMRNCLNKRNAPSFRLLLRQRLKK